jgi:hypothetical protein
MAEKRLLDEPRTTRAFQPGLAARNAKLDGFSLVLAFAKRLFARCADLMEIRLGTLTKRTRL